MLCRAEGRQSGSSKEPHACFMLHAMFYACSCALLSTLRLQRQHIPGMENKTESGPSGRRDQNTSGNYMSEESEQDGSEISKNCTDDLMGAFSSTFPFSF